MQVGRFICVMEDNKKELPHAVTDEECFWKVCRQKSHKNFSWLEI